MAEDMEGFDDKQGRCEGQKDLRIWQSGFYGRHDWQSHDLCVTIVLLDIKQCYILLT